MSVILIIYKATLSAVNLDGTKPLTTHKPF